MIRTSDDEVFRIRECVRGEWTMNENIAEEILHALFSSLEALETQNAAILQFLKDKGIASQEELAPHFERAGNASNVRWRATRARMDHLLSSLMKAADQDAQKPPDINPTTKTSRKNAEDNAQGTQQVAADSRPTPDHGSPSAKRGGNEPGEEEQ
jgi:hypothetical protein